MMEKIKMKIHEKAMEAVGLSDLRELMMIK